MDSAEISSSSEVDQELTSSTGNDSSVTMTEAAGLRGCPACSKGIPWQPGLTPARGLCHQK